MKKNITLFALFFAFVSSGQIPDNDSVIGTGLNNYVLTTDIQSEGKLIASGNFVEYNGAEVKWIARLNMNGTLDTGFNVGTGPSGIRDIAIQSDGKIIVGGTFSTFIKKYVME